MLRLQAGERRVGGDTVDLKRGGSEVRKKKGTRVG